MKIGYFLSSEERGPRDLVAQAVQAQEAGFEGSVDLRPFAAYPR